MAQIKYNICQYIFLKKRIKAKPRPRNIYIYMFEKRKEKALKEMEGEVGGDCVYDAEELLQQDPYVFSIAKTTPLHIARMQGNVVMV